MQNFINSLKKVSVIIAMILFFVVSGFYLVLDAGGFGGEFFPVISSLILMVFHVCLFILPGLLLLLKKKEGYKFVYLAVAAYVVISQLTRNIGTADGIVKNQDALYVIAALISFILGLGILGVVALILLGKLTGRETFVSLAQLISVLLLALYFLAFIFWIVLAIHFDATWTSYFDFLLSYLLLPAAIVFGWFALEEE